MKIITDNAAYVQKNDIAYLNSSDLPIPASIFMKVFGNSATIIDDRNRYDFVKFEDADEINFFKNIDWMIDYNEVKDKTEEELISLGQSIAAEKNDIAKKFNAMKEKDKRKNMKMVLNCELLDFKMYSLRDIIFFKRGELSITLPQEISEDNKSMKKRGFRKLCKK